MDAKILGVVFNCTSESSGGYYKRYNRYYKNQYYNKNYGRRYSRYYRPYGGRYAAAGEKTAKK